jgi:S1-C subfamily serine protease
VALAGTLAAGFVSAAEPAANAGASSLAPLKQLQSDLHELYRTAGASMVRVTVDQNAVAVLDPALRADFESWLKTSEAVPDRGGGRGSRGDGRGSRQNRGGRQDGNPGFGPGGFRGPFGAGGPGSSEQVQQFLESRAQAAGNEGDKERLRGLALRVRLNQRGFQGELSALILDDRGYLLLPTGLLREAHTGSLPVTLPDDSRTSAHFIGSNLRGGFSVLQLDKPLPLHPISWSPSKLFPGDLLVSISANQGISSLIIVAGRPGTTVGDRFVLTADERSGAFLFNTDGQLAGLAVGAGGNWAPDRSAFAASRVRREVDFIVRNKSDIEPLSLGVSFDPLSQHKEREEQLKSVLDGRRALYLTKVEEHSLADRAGLKVGDVLVSIDNRAVGTLVNNDSHPTPELNMLQVDLATRTGTVPLGVIRASQTTETTVDLPVNAK